MYLQLARAAVVVLAACASSPPAPVGRVPVAIKVGMVGEDYALSAHAAARAWNGALGYTAFVWASPPDVTFEFVDWPIQTPTGPARGIAMLGERPIRVGAVASDAEVSRCAVVHELGHVLGLGHDAIEGSAMSAEGAPDLMDDPDNPGLHPFGDWSPGDVSVPDCAILPQHVAAIEARR